MNAGNAVFVLVGIVVLVGAACWGWLVFRGEVVGWLTGGRDAPLPRGPRMRVTVKRHVEDPAEPEISLLFRGAASVKLARYAPGEARHLADAIEQAANVAARPAD